MIIRPQTKEFLARLQEPRRTIQVIAGPRQVGKTTMIKQVLQTLSMPARFFNADGVNADDKDWIADRWNEARALQRFNNFFVWRGASRHCCSALHGGGLVY